MTYPVEAQHAVTTVEQDVETTGHATSLAFLLSIPLFAFAGQWLVRLIGRRRASAAGVSADVEEHPVAEALKGLVAAVAFAAGSIVPFLIFEWPPFLLRTALAVAGVIVAIRIFVAVGKALVILAEARAAQAAHVLPAPEPEPDQPEVPPALAQAALAERFEEDLVLEAEPGPEMPVKAEGATEAVESAEPVLAGAGMEVEPTSETTLATQPVPEMSVPSTTETAAVTAPLPVTRPPAAFWYSRCLLFVSYFAIGWALVIVMRPLGFSDGTRLLVAYILGIGLVAIATEAVWSRPRAPGSANTGNAMSWLLTAYFIVLWCLWVAGLRGLLWIGIYIVLLPRVLAICSATVRAIRALAFSSGYRENSMAVVLLERGIRALVIALAAWWLAGVLGVEASTMAAGETVVDRIAKGVLGGVVILLVADLIWALAKAYINDRLDAASDSLLHDDEQRARAARIRTLLPIFRNILAGVIGVIAVLMVLAGLGIQIGPLIAGAGVVGVAVGFGAQTIVKDVISGMFYLWDDAFRIGEYIETGSHKGTVESFSLRSVKLRHHRGPVTTVPFGELGAVRNASRDWTVDKFTIRVTYDTDLNKLKKIIKGIGQELMDNPEYRPSIIEPLKMKGVQNFGEYAIEVRVGMTTKPGEQFMIRRDAMVKIKKAFRDNGIEFAVPTVQVSRHEDAESGAIAAAASQMMRASHPPEGSGVAPAA
ncbi:mechanosensitive ion channel family protein [Sinorhizobium sp. BG8]|nr:mechanosensitive ion channel family protein [Sinorhizobium sp. BG8]